MILYRGDLMPDRKWETTTDEDGNTVDKAEDFFLNGVKRALLRELGGAENLLRQAAVNIDFGLGAGLLGGEHELTGGLGVADRTALIPTAWSLS